MANYRQMFNAEMEKARNQRREDKEKAKAEIAGAKAKKEAAFQPLRDHVLPHLREAQRQLPTSVELDLEPQLKNLSDDRPHLMFQLKGGPRRRPTPVYRFTLAPNGILTAHQCEQQAERNTDKLLMSKQMDVVGETDVAEVIRIAFEEFARHHSAAS